MAEQSVTVAPQFAHDFEPGQRLQIHLSNGDTVLDCVVDAKTIRPDGSAKITLREPGRAVLEIAFPSLEQE